jgi:hypothetical protein
MKESRFDPITFRPHFPIMKESRFDPITFVPEQQGGKDVPFGPPPEEYCYRCSQCRHEMKGNEAITYHAHSTCFDDDPSKGSKSIAIASDYNPIFRTWLAIKLKDYEHRTSNVQRPTSNLE